MNHLRIALITPKGKKDYLTNTILDGLCELKEKGLPVSVTVSSAVSELPESDEWVLAHNAFIESAQKADLVFFFRGKGSTDFALAEEVGQWDKTIYIDGAEMGLNRGADARLQYEVLNGIYQGFGAIDQLMLERCRLYFRREKPYIDGIIPLPFGIDRSYREWRPGLEKDLDFVCVFGQEDYPPLRRYARRVLEQFCRENNFSYFVGKTKTRQEFYKLLARAKVGVSVGGGGYDTARFWEILGNNCLLLTQTIDIFHPPASELASPHIRQFGNLYDLREELSQIGTLLRHGFQETLQEEEHKRILHAHSSEARIRTVLGYARGCGLVQEAFAQKWGIPILIPPLHNTLDAQLQLPACFICGTRSEYLLEKDCYNMARCPKCCLVFVAPQPSSQYLCNEVYAQKAGYQSSKSRVTEQAKENRQTKRILRDLSRSKKGGRLLDVGASNGDFLLAARARGFTIQGVEINHGTASVAQERGLDVKECSLEDAAFPREHFDVIHLGDVLEHVPDPRKLLLECDRILAPCGTIVISTPNLDCLWSRGTFYFYRWFGIPWSSLTPPYHLYQFSYANLCELLNQLSFCVESSWFALPPSLRYELGQTHVLGEWRRHKRSPKVFMRFVFTLVLYGTLALVNFITYPFREKDFGMVLYASKLK